MFKFFVEFWERHNSMVSLVNMFYYQSSEKFALPAILTRELVLSYIREIWWRTLSYLIDYVSIQYD